MPRTPAAADWCVYVREDSSGKLHYTRLHYANGVGEAACGKQLEGQREHEWDAPPGTPKCKRCEARWATW